MPSRPRLAAGDLPYHVLNRRVVRLPLFETPADYAAFEEILAEAQAQTKIRIAAYCLMPNQRGQSFILIETVPLSDIDSPSRYKEV